MGHKDIEKMIADALAATDEPRRRVPLAHAKHILEQYVKLCDEGQVPEAEPSGDVAIPVTTKQPAAKAASANPISSWVKTALARVKR